MNRRKKWFLVVLTVFALGVLTGSGVQAASAGKWVTRDNGYSYEKNNSYLRGKKKIGKRYYYFDGNGIQRTGWRKISGKYYYFRVKNGSSGYMVTNKNVDGIKLKKSGAASMTGRAKKKMKVLIRAQEIVDEYTTPLMDLATKRRILYNHCRDDFDNYVLGDYITGNSDWDVTYAWRLLSGGYGDCYAHAAGFAYLLHAIGCSNVYVEHNGVHCWVHHRDYFFDVHWEQAYPNISCYHMPASASNTGGRPDWRNIGLYGKRVDA